MIFIVSHIINNYSEDIPIMPVIYSILLNDDL